MYDLKTETLFEKQVVVYACESRFKSVVCFIHFGIKDQFSGIGECRHVTANRKASVMWPTEIPELIRKSTMGSFSLL